MQPQPPKDYAHVDPDDIDYMIEKYEGPHKWMIATLLAAFVLVVFTGFHFAFNQESNMTHQSTMFIGEHVAVGKGPTFHPRGTHDTALPQSWVDAAHDRLGINPVGHVVWYYPPGQLAGHPLPVDEEGLIILSQLAGLVQ